MKRFEKVIKNRSRRIFTRNNDYGNDTNIGNDRNARAGGGDATLAGRLKSLPNIFSSGIREKVRASKNNLRARVYHYCFVRTSVLTFKRHRRRRRRRSCWCNLDPPQASNNEYLQ